MIYLRSKLFPPGGLFVRRFASFYFSALLALIFVSFTGLSVYGQSFTGVPSPTRFRVGEKLTYSISFGKLGNAGYAETYIASRGTLSGRDAIEIRSKIKTLDLVSAAFFMIDESRTIFVAPDTGLPLYISKNSNEGPIPREAIANYLTEPTSSYDIITLMFKARETSGSGNFNLFEKDRMYSVAFVPAARGERVSTEAGEFDTTVSTVQSEYLTANGITEMRINFSIDENRIPVLVRFRTAKGDFRIVLSASVMALPPTPLPTLVPTPVPTQTPARPKPTPSPEVYVENRPLAPELGFQLGELLEYRLTNTGRPSASIALNARERRLIAGEDSLVLTATITASEPGSRDFTPGDFSRVLVNPETLAPKEMESRFSSVFPGLNQTLSFDRRTGIVSFGGDKPIDAPVGTHTLLSLVYAMRSFNLQPSKDVNNPVNDTRVAVFWENKAYVFTLRPSNPEDITVNGEKVSAQLITINTGVPALDALNLKVWLATEDRVPLRFGFGTFQAELTVRSTNLSKLT